MAVFLRYFESSSTASERKKNRKPKRKWTAICVCVCVCVYEIELSNGVEVVCAELRSLCARSTVCRFFDIFFSSFLLFTIRIVRLQNAFRWLRKHTVDKMEMRKLVKRFHPFDGLSIEFGNLRKYIYYFFFGSEMDNVHFSLDNYDLPLCNFTRMA